MSYEDLEWDLFRLFYYIAKTGNYSKTAKALGITQPSISYKMKKLENMLGIKLFRRNGYSIELTKEGEELVPYVKEALLNIENGVSKITDIIQFKHGSISIGIPAHIGVFMLVDILKEFNTKYPDINIKVISKPTKDLVHLLNKNDLDIIIDSTPFDISIDELVRYKISEEKCYFACNKNRKELLDRKIKMNELNAYKIITPSASSGTTKSLKQVLMKNKVELGQNFEVSTSEMIAMMLEKDMGVGLLFEKTIETYPNLCKIDVDLQLPKFEVYLIYKKKPLSTPASEFVNFLLNINYR